MDKKTKQEFKSKSARDAQERAIEIMLTSRQDKDRIEIEDKIMPSLDRKNKRREIGLVEINGMFCVEREEDVLELEYKIPNITPWFERLEDAKRLIFGVGFGVKVEYEKHPIRAF